MQLLALLSLAEHHKWLHFSGAVRLQSFILSIACIRALLTDKARAMVQALFQCYSERPGEMSEAFHVPNAQQPGRSLQRRVADYVAGMTDRFALREHQRLTGQLLFETAGDRWGA